MKDSIKKTKSELSLRWHEKMPRFFYWLVVIACGIGGMAAAINIFIPMTGGVLHEWWVDLYPYIFGGSIGVVFTCKFTVAGGYKKIDPDKVLQGDRFIPRDHPQPNMSDVETEQPHSHHPHDQHEHHHTHNENEFG